MTVDPRAHDEAEAALLYELAKAQDQLHRSAERLHRAVNDTKVNRWTRQERWALSITDAILKARQMAPAALEAYQADLAVTDTLAAQVDAAEAVWREHGWSRFILCLSPNGHVHNYLGCHTLYADTRLQWHPEFSGLSEDDAVNGVGARDGLGPILCQHCYPSARAEYKRDPAEVNRERNADAKAAEKAERDAAKAAKNLADGERFRDTWGWVTTVAGAVKVLRDEREYHYYYGHGPHPSWAQTNEAAQIARRVLLAREAAHPGWGKTQAEIDKIIAAADKKNRKEAGI